MKLKEMSLEVKKLQEEQEGRDSLIMQQNSDISELYSINEQIQQDQKNLQEESEAMDEKIGQLHSSMEQTVQALQGQIEESTGQLHQMI